MTERITDQHRRVLCELIGIEWIEMCHWWCPKCESEKSPVQVTYRETCTLCGSEVQWIENKTTFTTWNDYGRCIEAIKGKGLWKCFDAWMNDTFFITGSNYSTEYTAWLLDPARCLEIAEFMERGKG